MRRLTGWILYLSLTLMFASCQSSRKVPYLQDTDLVNETEQSVRQTGVKVMPKDLLTIAVSCSTPELAAPFNLVNSGTDAPQQHLVDNQGNINFPVLGEIHVGGLTKLEIENLIIDKLKVYLKEAPLVTVRIVNYRISVLGEVNGPGSFVVSNEKINLLEALAMAGDLTIYGMRDNVKLIRTGQDNKQEIITLDLNKAETVLSPYYQLQQNDIIYVTPNKTKAKNSDIGAGTGLWFSGISILMSITNLLINILR
ncbi:polysaccharide biosynthesis/export family protein [Bacteroides finegoldii]|jgi:polysaccharide export outer membrane protein|uniref:polysaccharide biosynthesis/export family protein n=1 Tax=Bacteroides finegoldii TaxID=338188 RepID=UPI0026DB92E0|nr:polysaccharide biosynthesis/export family protein [Bacteroides finegoldii]